MIGAIVLPDSPAPGEVIIGIVTAHDEQDACAEVCWLSSSRGCFTCREQVSDIVVALLEDRNGFELEYPGDALPTSLVAPALASIPSLGQLAAI